MLILPAQKCAYYDEGINSWCCKRKGSRETKGKTKGMGQNAALYAWEDCSEIVTLYRCLSSFGNKSRTFIFIKSSFKQALLPLIVFYSFLHFRVFHWSVAAWKHTTICRYGLCTLLLLCGSRASWRMVTVVNKDIIISIIIFITQHDWQSQVRWLSRFIWASAPSPAYMQAPSLALFVD